MSPRLQREDFVSRSASELFLFFTFPDPRGCQGEWLLQSVLSSGVPGSLASLSLRKGRWKGGKWCVGACGAFLRRERVDPLGWGAAVAVLRGGTRMRKLPRREKEVRPHMHHSTHTESALRSCAHICATHARRARGLLGSESKEARAKRGKRRGTERSAVQHSARDTRTTATHTVHTHAHVSRTQSCRFVLEVRTSSLGSKCRLPSLCGAAVPTASCGACPAPGFSSRTGRGRSVLDGPRFEAEGRRLSGR